MNINLIKNIIKTFGLSSVILGTSVCEAGKTYTLKEYQELKKRYSRNNRGRITKKGNKIYLKRYTLGGWTTTYMGELKKKSKSKNKKTKTQADPSPNQNLNNNNDCDSNVEEEEEEYNEITIDSHSVDFQGIANQSQSLPRSRSTSFRHGRHYKDQNIETIRHIRTIINNHYDLNRGHSDYNISQQEIQSLLNVYANRLHQLGGVLSYNGPDFNANGNVQQHQVIPSNNPTILALIDAIADMTQDNAQTIFDIFIGFVYNLGYKATPTAIDGEIVPMIKGNFKPYKNHSNRW